MIGPEFGTVSRPDLAAAAREAAEFRFDTLIACAFSYDAACSDLDKLGRMRVLKARMNADIHMATDLRQTEAGNLFVVFGKPDIQIHDEPDDEVSVEVRGIDVFDPAKGEIRSDEVDGIACWFIDTDYDEESFFVRQAYFLGARDPYKSLKTSLKAEIDKEAWGPDGFRYAPKFLTARGHDFLDSIRSPSVWKKVKQQLAFVGGSASLEVVKTIAKKAVADVLASQPGQ